MFKKFADFYLKFAGLVGFLYGVVPVIICFAIMFLSIPFRSVYLLRLALSIIFAGLSGAFLNRYGLNLWLIKHRSPQGPGKIIDGMIIGAAIGFGTAFLTPLTALLGTNHLEMAKWFIIACWIAAVVIGFFWGGMVTAIGRKHINREISSEDQQG